MSIYNEERDDVSEASYRSITTYLQSESKVSVLSDEAAGIVAHVKKLNQQAKLKESELKKIIEVRDTQKDQLQQQIEELIRKVQANEDKILTLQQQFEDTSFDEAKQPDEETKQVDQIDEILERLSIDFKNIINLIDTDQKANTFATEFVPVLHEIKNQLDKKWNEKDICGNKM